MSHWTPNDGLNDDDDAGDDEVTPQYGGLEATIYLIDVASIARNQNHFRLTLECIENDLLKTIMENRKDLAGIVFYNTEKSPEPHDESECEVATITPAHCAIYVPLKPLSKQSIAYFKGFVNSDDQSDFANRYGTNPNGKFHEALWLCSRLLCQSQYKVASSTIVLFTNNEQPHMPGSVDMQQAMRRAKDLADIDSNVWLVPMVDEFNYDLFYKEFLSNVADEDLDAFRHVEPCVARDTLLHRVTRKTNRKKCLRHLRLIIGDGLEIGCDLHSFIKVIKKPSAIKMLRTTNETLVAKRSYVVKRKDPDDVAAESGGEQSENVQTVTVMPGELFKYQAIGGQEIAFSAEEMTSLKTLVAPGLRLLGFKPIDKLSSRCFVKACAFLAPSDGDIKGSTKLFRALWEKCSEKEVYALCTLTYRRKVPPRYVALVPQTDNVDGKDGFRIVYVPMETDYNHLDVLDTEPPTVSDESVELLSKLCKKLRFVYTPDMFSNPSLQKFYEELEALVFDETPEEFTDETLPEAEMQDEKIKDYVAAIHEEFGSDPTATASKRSNSSATNGNQSKAAKTDLSMSDIEQAIMGGRASKCNIQQLKDFLRSKNVSFSSNAKKADLMTLAENTVN